ncbi:hypothetical protein SADUNF_Sadunf03G0076900 [Salix dunnii]|uniref:Uncharacterized protein n=1 Tax=Salix dunnii TaxID=1413687 RepID=A0A835N1U8_9ROSI|nr:hypothetical protein SADUNF_Sadunf03G0076900 [Salix dunnii]
MHQVSDIHHESICTRVYVHPLPFPGSHLKPPDLILTYNCHAAHVSVHSEPFNFFSVHSTSWRRIAVYSQVSVTVTEIRFVELFCRIFSHAHQHCLHYSPRKLRHFGSIFSYCLTDGLDGPAELLKNFVQKQRSLVQKHEDFQRMEMQ